MPTRRRSASAPKKSDAPEISETDLSAALSVIRLAYYGDVKRLAGEIQGFFAQGEYAHADQLDEHLAELVHASRWCRSPGKAKLGLAVSAHPARYNEQGSGAPVIDNLIDYSDLMFWAMIGDVMDHLPNSLFVALG